VGRDTPDGGKNTLEARHSQKILESIDAIVWEFDAEDFATTYVSPQIERILGYSLNHANGEPNLWKEIVHPDDLDAVITECNKLHDRADRYDFEYRMRTADGEWRWFRDATTVVREGGEPVRFRCILTDITNKHLAQETLERSRERLAYAQQVAKLGDWEWDIRQDMITWSDQCFRIFGLEPQAAEFDFETYQELLDPKTAEMIRRAVERALAKGLAYTFEHPITRPDGTRIIVRAYGEPVYDGEELIYLRGTVQDVTARHEVEQLKDKLIALVSHELRTPLTPLVGLISLLSHDEEVLASPRLTHMLNMARRNADRLVEVVDAFLEVRALTEEVSDTFTFEEVELYDVLVDALDQRSDLHETHALAVHAPDEPVVVTADRERLCAAVAKLLANAEKFSPADGVIEIEITRTVEVARLSIRDHGPGIDDGFRARIFERFSQADGPDTRDYGGVGLGLAIAKTIIDRHDGSIRFEGPDDGGTVAIVELPTAD
jgi:PAS domain S-box-containing protein